LTKFDEKSKKSKKTENHVLAKIALLRKIDFFCFFGKKPKTPYFDNSRGEKNG